APRPLDQSANGEPPIGKIISGEPLVIGVARFGGSVGAKFGREVGLGVLASERSATNGHPLRPARDRFGAVEQPGEFEVFRKLVPPAQYQAAGAASGASEKLAAAHLLDISHVLLQCRTSR